MCTCTYVCTYVRTYVHTCINVSLPLYPCKFCSFIVIIHVVCVVCTCRFFFGKTKVMQVALGRTDADEYMEGLHLISKVCVCVCL